MIRIFISHSHLDNEIAKKLTEYLKVALKLEASAIRCTSVIGHELEPGENIESYLQNEIKEGDIALIGLLTKHGLASDWVLFELGAAWGKGKKIIPILGPGLKVEDLPGPLKNYKPVSIDSKFSFNAMIRALSKRLEIDQLHGDIQELRRDELIEGLKNWQLKSLQGDNSQEVTEQLKNQRQELEKSHQQKLNDVKRDFEIEKDELDKEYQQKKREIEQSHQSTIRQLEQERSKRSKLTSDFESIEKRLAEKEADNAQLIERIARLQDQEQAKIRSNTSNTENSLKIFNFEILIVNSKGEVTQKKTKQARYFTDSLSNNLDLEMIYIPGGEFWMGTEEKEIERLCKKHGKDYFKREKPQHQVTIQPFLMGKYAVTQAQWRVVAALPQIERELETDPSRFNRSDRPVEQVSWYDAVEFCARLSQLTKRDYRLPSEAEWEYACRAGTTTPFYFGETITGDLVNYDASYTYLDETKGKYREETTPVGQFPPNANGLFDMHGNVWEWCADTWHKNYQGALTEGTAWIKNGDDSRCCLRGGSWIFSPRNCRSAYRNHDTRASRYNHIGFRVSCELPRTFS